MDNIRNIRKILMLLCGLFLLTTLLLGYNYFVYSEKEEEKCIFKIKTPNDDGKVDHVMFFLMYKFSKIPDSSRSYEPDDYYDFNIKKNCRTVLETILEKI